MKTIKCPICGSENKYEAKYCRICFSRLSFKESRILNTNFSTEEFYPKIIRHKNIFTLVFILLLLFLIWLLVK